MIRLKSKTLYQYDSEQKIVIENLELTEHYVHFQSENGAICTLTSEDIPGARVDDGAFLAKAGVSNNTYTFMYENALEGWMLKHNSQAVTLSEYGIDIGTASPEANDKITVSVSNVASVSIVNGEATIPNQFLKWAGNILILVYCTDSNKQRTTEGAMISVTSRPVPPEYVLNPSPVITYPQLVELVADLTALKTKLHNITATATTLVEGSSATATCTETDSGIAFAFGIPRGQRVYIKTGQASALSGTWIIDGRTYHYRFAKSGTNGAKVGDLFSDTVSSTTYWYPLEAEDATYIYSVGRTKARGNGIDYIYLYSSIGLTKTYRIVCDDGDRYDFQVVDGKGITSITKTSTSGLVDTHTITYNDNTTSTFTVTNGEDGVYITSASIDGLGHLVVTLSDSSVIDAGVAKGPKGDTGDSGVYYGSSTPTDPDIKVWIDPNGTATGLPVTVVFRRTGDEGEYEITCSHTYSQINTLWQSNTIFNGVVFDESTGENIWFNKINKQGSTFNFITLSHIDGEEHFFYRATISSGGTISYQNEWPY